MVDPNMLQALKWGNDLGESPTLPNSLQNISNRKDLVLELDKPFLPQSLIKDYNNLLSPEEKNQCLNEILSISKRFITDVNDDKEKINICLRLWSGCLSTAKTIAIETNDGPNTPEIRYALHNKITELAENDLIFQAGAEVAEEFIKARNEEYSFEGIPNDSFLKKTKF